MKKKLSVFTISILFALLPVFADEAMVTYTKGKVEVNRKNAWIQLNVGDTVSSTDVISTGFQSEAKLEYNGTVLVVGALTRVTLDNISSSESKDDVSVYLKTGAVRTKVTHTSDRRVACSIKTPVAVASVRGTEFLITSVGDVECYEGAVAVYPNRDDMRPGSGQRQERPAEENNTDEAGDEPENPNQNPDFVPDDNGPARPTTPANRINSDVPAGALVVGKNQAITVNQAGGMETPMISASRRNESVLNFVGSAADSEAIHMGGDNAMPMGPGQNNPPPDIDSPFAQDIKDALNPPSGSVSTTVVLQD